MLNLRIRQTLYVLGLLTLTYGCTSRDLYRAGQNYQRERCRSAPQSEYDQCMEQANESYESYQRKKQSVADSE